MFPPPCNSVKFTQVSPEKTSQLIKKKAYEAGFDFCGIAQAVPLDEDARRLEAWLNRGLHGGMQYMERYFDLRVDPTRLVPGARSVITLLKNYYPAARQEPASPRIAKYAFGRDYHEVIRSQLRGLLDELSTTLGAIHGRGFVDSAPVLERTWAQRSGLGWIGRNGNLLTRQGGSFFFIATLITDLEMAWDDPFAKDYCGTCTRCIAACPTEAILPDKVVDASRCISYFTIELKEQLIPEEMNGKFEGWMFGCDTCQDVCPWNRFSRPHHEPAFTPIPELLNLTTRQWEEMTEETFKQLFRHSPLKRAAWQGIRRNLRFLNSGT
ncbi:MAG TPA: tRNA epoxyqueuosine(34) reductase QueG [Chitinophagaceae bacterium]|nr:tRNA epoxyqueuosine(34) reductase QueG [Chitinophagaceae bacterium]